MQTPLPNVEEGALQTLGQPVRKRFICPQVIYLDYQNDISDFDVLTAWITYRRMTGYPLKKVWIGPSIAIKLTKEQKVRLWDALGGIGMAQIASCRTMEEEAMCKQV
jgi:hypothetical protein